MTISDGLMIIVVLIAPFLAVFAQKQIELWRERRARKLLVFKMLMATRARVLSPEHVQALNMIELEFTNSSDKAVLTAWKEYHDHLNSYPREGENQKERAAVWNQETEKLLAALLGQMGKSLGYDFDPVQIRRGAYSPEGHVITELELQLLRRMLLELLAGKGKIPVVIVPKDEEATKQGEKFLEGILSLL
ncbi:hypothetical protein MUO65_04030, partial [bacterium]|nr:hypothetical protein [bacterium]